MGIQHIPRHLPTYILTLFVSLPGWPAEGDGGMTTAPAELMVGSEAPARPFARPEPRRRLTADDRTRGGWSWDRGQPEFVISESTLSQF